jgi:hypothetical protein
MWNMMMLCVVKFFNIYVNIGSKFMYNDVIEMHCNNSTPQVKSLKPNSVVVSTDLKADWQFVVCVTSSACCINGHMDQPMGVPGAHPDVGIQAVLANIGSAVNLKLAANDVDVITCKVLCC